jgi:hypothetical protein
MSSQLQVRLHDHPVHRVVVSGQDSKSPGRHGRHGLVGVLGVRLVDSPRVDREPEAAAAAELAPHVDVAPHEAHQISADREAEAGAAKAPRRVYPTLHHVRSASMLKRFADILRAIQPNPS